MNLYQMRVAFYARRSTDEHQMASLDVQREEGARFVEREGGILSKDHVYLDDAISRAEFKKRPGLIAMLNAAKAGQFDAIVVRDESRLGGDTFRSGLVIQDLLDSGARLFYYYTGEEVTLDGAVDKFMVAARSFAAELEREKTSQRTHEHLMTKARRGLVVGGRVYGYDNVEVKEGDRRVRVEYKVNEAEAEIVREIFSRYASGEGLRTIAKDLNVRRVAPPRAGKRGTGSWSYSSIYAMVRRDRYRGILVWGKQEKTYKGGTKVRVERAKDEWITTEAPTLRIVDEDLWNAVQARNAEQARTVGTLARGPKARYLLSGIGRCAECGGPMRSDNGKVSYETVRVYNCAWHRDRGPAVCQNGLRRPIAAVDRAVLAWVRENILQEDVILRALHVLRQRLTDTAKTTSTEAPELEDEARKLRAEIERLGEAIVSTRDAPTTLVRMMAEREKRLTVIEARLASIKTAPSVLDLEVRRMEKEARERIERFQKLIDRHPDQARGVLEKLITRPFRFTPVETPEGKRYSIDGEVDLEALFVVEKTESGGVPFASPAGRKRLPNPDSVGDFTEVAC